MSYYFSKIVDYSYEEGIRKVTEELKKEGFGVLTQIDVKSTLKEKLDVDFRKYKILGACNPNYAYQALQTERMIGAMLPCNVLVQETEEGKTEIAAINPTASMRAVENENLEQIAGKVTELLKLIIDRV